MSVISAFGLAVVGLARSQGYTVKSYGPGELIVRKKEADHKLSLYRSLYAEKDLERKPFINIGAGAFSHPYWTNVDYVSDWYAGMQKDIVPYDIMSKAPLPFETGEIKIAYTSHCIEHVTDDAAASLFREVHRVLEPGGLFRLTTPDAEADYRAFMAGDARWFSWDKMYHKPGSYEDIYHRPADSVPLAERWLHHLASQLCPNDKSPSERKFTAAEILEIVKTREMTEVFEYFCQHCAFNPEIPRNHITWWTGEKLMGFLREAGFSTVYTSGFHQSAAPVMRQSYLFDTKAPHASLYVEAVKH